MKIFEIYVTQLKLAGILVALIATRFGTQSEITTHSNHYKVSGVAQGTVTVAEIYNYAKGVQDMYGLED